MPPENVPSPQEASAEWQAQYEFFTKIISDEVARSRFNEGFEPIDIDLYESSDERGRPEYIGKVRICGRDFIARLREGISPTGEKILKISIRVQGRSQHH